MPKKVNEMKTNTKQVRLITSEQWSCTSCSINVTFNNENYFKQNYNVEALIHIL